VCCWLGGKAYQIHWLYHCRIFSLFDCRGSIHKYWQCNWSRNWGDRSCSKCHINIVFSRSAMYIGNCGYD